MRRTKNQLAVAAALLAEPTGRHYGYSLMIETGIPSGVLYPMLSRMAEADLLECAWQEIGSHVGPVRRYYTLTDKGRAELGALIADTEVTSGHQD